MDENRPLLDIERRASQYGSISPRPQLNHDVEKYAAQMTLTSAPYITTPNTWRYRLCCKLSGTYDQRSKAERACQPSPMRLAPALRNPPEAVNAQLDYAGPILLSDQLLRHWFQNIWIHDEGHRIIYDGRSPDGSPMVQSPLFQFFKQQKDYENYGVSLFRTFLLQILFSALLFASGCGLFCQAPLIVDKVVLSTNWIMKAVHVQGAFRSAIEISTALAIIIIVSLPISMVFSAWSELISKIYSKAIFWE